MDHPGKPRPKLNSSPWFFDGPNRNRWFTYVYLLKMGGSFHGEVLNNNQMVIVLYDFMILHWLRICLLRLITHLPTGMGSDCMICICIL